MTREEAIRCLEICKKHIDKIRASEGVEVSKEVCMALDMAIKALEQEPKTGHWICYEEQFNTLGIAIAGGVKCSECGYTTHNKLHMELGCPYKYCPNCGAKMESEAAE